jgi:hypothetical protein
MASYRFLFIAVLLFLAMVLAPTHVSAEEPAKTKSGNSEFSGLDASVQSLKQEVMELNRDLFLLEEELLFPANTQVAVFLSMDIGSFFQLDAVQVKIDNKIVANYLYTTRELDALVRGGVHRLYLGNLRVGQHEMVASFTGRGPHGRDYRRGASLLFDKETAPKYLELKITDVEHKLQPEFRIKEWQ